MPLGGDGFLARKASVHLGPALTLELPAGHPWLFTDISRPIRGPNVRYLTQAWIADTGADRSQHTCSQATRATGAKRALRHNHHGPRPRHTDQELRSCRPNRMSVASPGLDQPRLTMDCRSSR